MVPTRTPTATPNNVFVVHLEEEVKTRHFMWKGDGLIEFSPLRPCVTNGGPVRGFGSITLESVTPVTPFPPVRLMYAN